MTSVEMSKQGRTRLIYAIFSEEFIFLMFPMKIFFISVTTTSRILKIRLRHILIVLKLKIIRFSFQNTETRFVEFMNASRCRFLVLGNTQKILTEIWHQIWDKNDGENICHWNYFQIPRALSELPANWPGLYFKTEIIWKIKMLLWKLFSYIVNYLAMIILRFSFKIENAQQRNNALLFVALHAGNHFLLSFFQLPRYIDK